MTKERIEDIRQSVIPFVKKWLLEINNDGLGEYDAKEFENDLNEVLDLAIKALETVEEFEKAQIITGGRLNGRTYAYQCGLRDGERKALEQHTSDNCVTENQSQEFPETFEEYANDYGFIDDKEIYTNGSHLIPVFRVQQWLEHIKQPTSDDCVSRQAVIEQAKDYGSETFLIPVNSVKVLPPVTPTQRWIPVSERLPKENERVLVNQTINNSNRNVVYCTRFPFEKTKVEYITAWQPLPKPYKEKRSKENE